MYVLFHLSSFSFSDGIYMQLRNYRPTACLKNCFLVSSIIIIVLFHLSSIWCKLMFPWPTPLKWKIWTFFSNTLLLIIIPAASSFALLMTWEPLRPVRNQNTIYARHGYHAMLIAGLFIYYIELHACMQDEIARGDRSMFRNQSRPVLHERNRLLWRRCMQIYLWGDRSNMELKKMNKEILMDTHFSQDFIRTIMNGARIAQYIYQYGDGHGRPILVYSRTELSYSFPTTHSSSTIRVREPPFHSHEFVYSWGPPHSNQYFNHNYQLSLCR